MKPLSQTSNVEIKKSTANITELMHKVLDIAKKQGASSAQVYCNHDIGFSVDVREGETETVQFNEDQSISVTIFDGYKKGSASSTDLSEKALIAMVKHANDIAKVSAEDKAFGLADKELMATKFPDLQIYHPWNIEPHDAIKLAIECERQALNEDKRIYKSDSVNVSTVSGCHGYANSHGFNGILCGTRHSISLSLIAKENDNMQRDYDYSVNRNPNYLEPIEVIAKNAVYKTVSRLNAKKANTQKVPVVFSNRVSAGLIASFINAISGGNLYRKNSFLLNAIESQVFPEFVKIYEQPYLEGALGSTPYDNEGVQTRNNVFVDQGILKSYVLSSYTARKLNLKTTANAGGVFNLTVKPTHGSFDEIIAPIKEGLLVTELMGQGVNILTGDYSRGASGFWIENGKIVYPVEEITIAGNLRDIYKNIVAIGNDYNPNLSMKCGSIFVEEMTIAGK